MKFSLILATEGRTDELSNFLSQLVKQEFVDYELIIIDQNPDNRVLNILRRFQSHFQSKYIRNMNKGLSRSRNNGVQRAQGEIIAFPDDDCWYPPFFLGEIAQRFDAQPSVDGFTGRTVDEENKSIIRFAKEPGYITKINAWQRVNSSSMFFRKYVISGVGPFDEDLGPGSGTLWGSADDVDYVIRCSDMGYRVYYDPNIVAFHLDHRRYGYSFLHSSAFKYGAGIGRVWRKHKFPYWYICYHLLRPIGGAIISFAEGKRSKAIYHWQSLKGRWVGWRSK